MTERPVPIVIREREGGEEGKPGDSTVPSSRGRAGPLILGGLQGATLAAAAATSIR